MIAVEIERSTATIRIHDEFLDHAPENRMQHLNRIVTDHYKRRYVTTQQENNAVASVDNQAPRFE